MAAAHWGLAGHGAGAHPAAAARGPAGPDVARGTLARRDFEKAAVLHPQLRRTRPVRAALYAIKGSVMWKLTKGGTGEGHPRYFRLYPSTSMVQWDSAEPILLLGALPGLSAAARRAIGAPARALGPRAFRFVFGAFEVDVIARSPAERDLWLLAVASLPIGGAFADRVELKNKFELIGQAPRM